MLSNTAIPHLEASLPAVAAAIDDIASVFYRRLFTAHPNLERDLFNRGNQRSGTQVRVLAGSIAAFATRLLDDPDARPNEGLRRIAHKHASLGITREQYQVVKTHLFEAIVEVLGDAVTPPIAGAWNEVYWLMANALIAAEQQLYADAGVDPGRPWRDHQVVGLLQETTDVTTFIMRPLDGAPVNPSLPGQYVSVRVRLSDGAQQIRQYSVTTQEPDSLRFSVKRVAGTHPGEVSNHLHDRIRLGDVLTISHPFGDVTLDDSDRPVFLASAGIGATPIVDMLNHLVAEDSPRRVTVVHADRAPSVHPLRSDLEQLTAKLPNATLAVWYESPEQPWPADRTGRIDLQQIEVPSGSVAYLCGPVPFMRSVRGQLLDLGVDPADVHYESFGPDLGLAEKTG
ncbi:MAG: hemin transporter [Pseudonocardia sp. SCN 73-27]|uniref:globin domain-containing protein n=1 Tax=Pseudonocardia sp. SCN 73-27 TaxID=1660132 RepID=UPI00086CE681|nr:globin domain-containing protein [Pseudonocardia sp. SCN 73-27]ODU25418.1 MAG: hemin transporter [Pseudonocardia sp. SCN 72-51]ODU99558.1 MAG: hemin transporter [Pseudonocardia sp. SCN 73-27]